MGVVVFLIHRCACICFVFFDLLMIISRSKECSSSLICRMGFDGGISVMVSTFFFLGFESRILIFV